MSAWPEPIHGVIFDIDGLLLDTEPIFVMAMEKTTGHPLSKEFHIKLMGRSGFEAAPWIIEKYSLSYTEEEVVNKIDENLSSLLPNAKLFPGTHNLVARLKEMKLPLGLATGSNRINFGNRTRPHQEFFSQFQCATCGDEVKQGKPNPEIFLKTMEKMGITNPKNVLVFEDAPAGVKCANNAGMAVVMVPDKDLPLEESLGEFDAKPTIVLKSLSDFDFNAFKFK
ncbi:haloacid dehalogenase-like hydrolase family protein [Histomonas meleagridis]|uniref:haloacid dehalogenase-like hydrolase family protein n=1 Tax=Histomonas meleagridis TaxID=135588 RepID=UPI0035596D2D|nr:haloacid dehalogenase-like hydrolase family protein [Histomonas meleagridis]KAH0805861.1 haloacid dehalogenase-like hydrolase family protein [Histomonas meleagridis]